MRKGLLLLWVGLGFLLALLFLMVWNTEHMTALHYGEPLRVDQAGLVWQQEEVVGRFKPTASGLELRLKLVTPQTATDAVTGVQQIQFLGQAPYSALQPRLVSIQGNEPFQLIWNSQDTLQISMVGALPDGYPTLLVQAPGDYFQPSWGVRLIDGLINLNWVVMLVCGLIGLGLVYLYMMRAAQPVSWVGTEELETPPRDLKPLELALLHHSQIRAVDLAAMLYDLAQRNYLQIIVHAGGEPVFLRTSKEGGLLSYERFFLILLFPDGSRPMSMYEVTERVSTELFSAVVSQLYVELYDSFTRQGYLRDNPRMVHLRYKTVAIVTQIVGVLASVMSFIFLKDFWPVSPMLGIGLYAAGYLIFKLGYTIVPLSKSGLILLREAANFRHYLSLNKPLKWASVNTKVFYQLVPHALALDVVNPWLNRFKEHTSWFVPDWYDNLESSTVTPEDFVSGVLEVGECLGAKLTKVVDPNID